MMIVFDYATKKELKASIGQKLKGVDMPLVNNGVLVGCNRPVLTGFNREFYARVLIINGLIAKVT